jgi:hypothetical protein
MSAAKGRKDVSHHITIRRYGRDGGVVIISHVSVGRQNITFWSFGFDERHALSPITQLV